jgi:sec-independent protein translocase protein TatB
MIDLGLTKIALIGVVALVVIGPERLPKVARMAGTLFGRAQRYINDIKSEVSREIELEELRRMQKEVQEAASSVEQSIAKNLNEVKTSVEANTQDIWNDRIGDFDDPSVGPLVNPLLHTPTPDQIAVKVRDFRRKKLARTAGIPGWYKKQSGHKTRVISGAARVAKYSPARAGKSSASFYS